MADQQLNIRLNVIDNATKAFTEVKNSIFSIKSALIGLGVGATLKGILKAGSEAEKLRSQFLQLAPSIDEGRKAFQALQKFTANSPLPSEQIEQSASAIFALTKNSDTLISSLTAIQNASIALNIPLETLSREFNNLSINGIEGTRELKRRGLENILGFTDGVKREPKVAVEEFLKVFGANGRFGLASSAFANTFEGATNRFFKSIKGIQGAIAEAGLLDFFTDLTNAITDIIKDNPEQLKEFVTSFANSTKEIIQNFLGFADTIIALTKPIFDFTVQAFKDLYSFLKLFPKEVQEIGLIGFLLLGRKGQVAILAGATIYAKIKRELQDLGIISKENESTIDNQNEGLFNQFQINDKINLKSKERTEQQNLYLEQQRKLNDLKQKESFLLDEIITKFKILNETELNKVKDTTRIIVQNFSQILKDIAEGLAQFIVLGKSLTETFKDALQKALIRILSTQIEILLRISTQLLLEQLKKIELVRQGIELLRNLSIEKLITKEKEAQANASGQGGGSIERKIFSAIAGSFFAEGGNIQAGQPAIVGERGRELFVPSTNGTIVPNHDMGSGMNITFNIQANDVRGIKELLIDNRATIINLVNQGANQKGKSNVI
jgi:hypothetical protein